MNVWRGRIKLLNIILRAPDNLKPLFFLATWHIEQNTFVAGDDRTLFSLSTPEPRQPAVNTCVFKSPGPMPDGQLTVINNVWSRLRPGALSVLVHSALGKDLHTTATQGAQAKVCEAFRSPPSFLSGP